jgi:hypothetical protein
VELDIFLMPLFMLTKRFFQNKLRTGIVLLSYAIVAASAASIFGVSFLIQGYSYYSPFFSPAGFAGPLGLFLAIMAVAGLVLGPYFALAGLIVKDGSVWVEVNRMLHAHISMPIIGGLVLFYSTIFSWAFYEVFPGYVAVVSLVTLISVMATKRGRQSVYASPPSSPVVSK